jgi:hypothetical protein
MGTHRFKNKMKLALTPYQEGIKRVFWNNLIAFNTLMAALLVAFSCQAFLERLGRD